MRKRLNEVTGIVELLTTGTLKSIGSVKQANNANQTPYRICTAEVEYPDGSKATVGALMWEASREANPDSFTTGSEIELRIQTEGDYAGNAVVGLTTLAKFDLTKVALQMEELEVEQP